MASSKASAREVGSDGDPYLPEGLTSSEWQSIQNQILSNLSQQAYLKASNTNAYDEFGYSVAVSNDTVVVGAWKESSAATGVNGDQNSNSAPWSGAAYVFVRDGATWAQQAYLKASNTDAYDRFGTSVAVSNDTIVVGAYDEDSAATGVNGDQNNNSAPWSGAAYVFVRSGTTWTQQAYLKASNTGANDFFGNSVAVSNDTIVVGAYFENSAATGVDGNQNDESKRYSGAAYVFVRSGTFWAQQAYLKASNTDAGDYFGYSVAVSNDTIVVGAYDESSAATGVNGDQNNNGASGSGAAYVFVRSGTAWSQQAYLKASNTDEGDQFGRSVAVSNDTIVVGANGEDSAATGVDGDQNDNSGSDTGAAYVFVRDGTTWTQQAYLKASNTDAYDYFGTSVAISNDTLVVGADYEDSAATGIDGDQNDNSAAYAGAAYVFVRDGTNWTQQAYLKASNTNAYDDFGVSVAVSNDTLVVGAPYEDSAATGVNGDQNNNSAPYAGAAYVFIGEMSIPPVSITGIEINQALGVQKNNEQNYVAGKDAVIRVLMDQPVVVNPSTQSLEVKRGGAVIANLRPNNYPSSVNSIDFFLSPSLTNCSGCGNSETYTITANIDGNLFSKTVDFHKSNKIRILVRPVTLIFDDHEQSLSTDEWKYAYHFLQQTYPIARGNVEWVIGEPMRRSAKTLVDSELRSLAQELTFSRLLCGLLPLDYCRYDARMAIMPPLYIPDGTMGLRLGGNGIVVFANGSFSLGEGAEAPIFTIDFMQAVVAHEIGHAYGLGDEYDLDFANYVCDVNPPPEEIYDCGEISQPEPWPGPGTGSLIPASDHPFELTGYGRGLLTDKVSFMGNYYHQADIWISKDAYSKLFYELKQNSTTNQTQINETGRVILASGWIGQDDSLRLEPWYHSDGQLPMIGTGDYSIEAQDSIGTVLSTQFFDISFTDESNPPKIWDEALFSISLAYPEGTARFVIKHGSTILGTREIASTLPSVSLTSPNGGEVWDSETMQTVTWDGLTDGSVFYTLLYAHDGVSFDVLAVNLTTNSYEVDPAYLVGGENARFKIFATDGVNTVEDTTDGPFTVLPKMPDAFLHFPEDGAQFPYGLSIILDGSGYDLEDGILSGENITWSSDVDGFLGTGENLLVDLSYGYHTLTLEVQDSDGNTSQKSISVFIGTKVYLPTVIR